MDFNWKISIMKNKATLFSILVSFLSIILVSCVENERVNYPDIQLYPNEKFTIPSGSNWYSNKPRVASIEGNVITANKVGRTRLSGSNGSFNVDVVPRTTNFDDLCLIWGSTKGSVKNKMSRYSILKEDESSLLFSVRGMSLMYQYMFRYSLYMSGINANADIYNDLVLDYLADRYYVTLVDEDDYTVLFEDVDSTMDIMLTYSLLNNTVYASVIYSQHTKELKSSGLEMIDDALPANRVPLDKNYTPAQEAKVDSLFSVLKQKIALPPLTISRKKFASPQNPA